MTNPKRRGNVDLVYQETSSDLDWILARIGDILEQLPMAVCIYDRLGRIVRFNQAAVEVWRRTPEPGVTHQTFVAGAKFFSPDGEILSYAEMPLVKVLRAGVPVREQEFSIERPDGSRVTTVANVNPLRDFNGNVIGAINCFRNITDRKLIDEALKQSQRMSREQEQRLAATYEHAAIGISEVDAYGRFLRVNGAICNITGQSREALLRGKLFDRTYPDDRDADQDAFLKQVRGELDSYSIEKRYIRQNGDVRWMAVKSTSVRDAGGQFLYAVRVIQDITESKAAEQRQQLLIDELNHRTKNTLAMVQALFWQTARDNLPPKALREAFEGRLVALGKAHDQLTLGYWERAPLKDIIEAGIGPYLSDKNNRIALQGDRVVLKPKAALSLAMAFHELTTNAAKYGALSLSSGRIRVQWETINPNPAKPPLLKIEWREEGGPSISPPKRRGFGLKFIEASIASDLHGTSKITFEKEGFSCTMKIPRDALA